MTATVGLIPMRPLEIELESLSINYGDGRTVRINSAASGARLARPE